MPFGGFFHKSALSVTFINVAIATILLPHKAGGNAGVNNTKCFSHAHDLSIKCGSTDLGWVWGPLGCAPSCVGGIAWCFTAQWVCSGSHAERGSSYLGCSLLTKGGSSTRGQAQGGSPASSLCLNLSVSIPLTKATAVQSHRMGTPQSQRPRA